MAEASGTVGCRLSIRVRGDEESLFETDGSEPVVHVPPRRWLRPGGCEWRLWNRSSNDAPWGPCLPEMVMVDERLAAARGWN